MPSPITPIRSDLLHTAFVRCIMQMMHWVIDTDTITVGKLRVVRTAALLHMRRAFDIAREHDWVRVRKEKQHRLCVCVCRREADGAGRHLKYFPSLRLFQPLSSFQLVDRFHGVYTVTGVKHDREDGR